MYEHLTKKYELSDEFLTVREFAQKINKSSQAVYKQLDNQLKPYWRKSNGKKVISIRALEIYDKPKNAKNDNQLPTELSTELSKIVELLTTQLTEKDKQIENLQKLLNQSQQLQAQSEQKIALLEAKKTKKHWWSKKSKTEVDI